MPLWKSIEKMVEQGLDASRDMIDKARVGATDLTEIGTLKFDILQLQRQYMKLLSLLGHKVYATFNSKEQQTISKNTVGVKGIISELTDIEKRIHEKEETITRLQARE